MARLKPADVVLQAIRYRVADQMEGHPRLPFGVLMEQVRVLERIHRLEEYLTLLIQVTSRTMDAMTHDTDEQTHDRVDVLDARFKVAEDALRAAERIMP